MVNRDPRGAWSYHVGTEHTDGRLMNARYTYGLISSQLLFKLYEGLGPIPAPRDAPFTNMPALPAIAIDIAPADDGHMPEISVAARMLYFSAGITETF